MLKNVEKAKTETIVSEIIKVNKEYQELKKYLDSLKDELKARTNNDSESYETNSHKVTVVYKKASVVVDTEKVKAIPNWETLYGKEKSASKEVRITTKKN